MDIINLLFGFGLGLSRYSNLESTIMIDLPAYDDFSYYLLLLYEVGLIGLVSFIYGFVCFTKKYCITRNQIILLIMILASLVTFDYFSYFWIYAIILGVVKNESMYIRSIIHNKKIYKTNI